MPTRLLLRLRIFSYKFPIFLSLLYATSCTLQELYTHIFRQNLYYSFKSSPKPLRALTPKLTTRHIQLYLLRCITILTSLQILSCLVFYKEREPFLMVSIIQLTLLKIGQKQPIPHILTDLIYLYQQTTLQRFLSQWLWLLHNRAFIRKACLPKLLQRLSI